jgi:hypothetical protein
MPKIISKSKLKVKLGTDLSALDGLIKMLSGDPDYVDDISAVYDRAIEFNNVLNSYMLARFNIGKCISIAYIEAGTRVINDNQLIITPIKTYLNIMNKCKSKFIGTLEKDVDNIKLYKKTYFEFKKSKVIMDAIIICNNLTTDKELLEMDNLCPFKNIFEYESENLNLKFIQADPDISQELKDELFKHIQELHDSTSKLHTMYNTPDIDIDSVFPELMKLFDVVLKDLKGCKETRNLIKKYSEMFSNNFTSYFKNFKVTESPFGILEDFIVDITNDQKNKDQINPKIITELAVILSTIRKKVNNPYMNNPKIAKAMNMVETALNNMSNYKEDKPQEDIQQQLNDVVSFLSDLTGDDIINDQSENNTNA